MTRGLPLVLDADVLIDYLGAEPEILRLTADHFGEALVLLPVLEEVEELSEDLCQELGLDLRLPSTEQLVEAVGRAANSPLSVTDCLCHVVARDAGCICVTNDKRLRARCERDGVPLLWGLELMIELAETRVLSRKEAETIAWRIHERNVRISRETILRFCTRLRRTARE